MHTYNDESAPQCNHLHTARGTLYILKCAVDIPVLHSRWVHGGRSLQLTSTHNWPLHHLACSHKVRCFAGLSVIVSGHPCQLLLRILRKVT